MIRVQYCLVEYKVRDAAVTQKSEPLIPRNTGGNLGSASEREVARTQRAHILTQMKFLYFLIHLGKKTKYCIVHLR